jgi:hypothetical protein
MAVATEKASRRLRTAFEIDVTVTRSAQAAALVVAAPRNSLNEGNCIQDHNTDWSYRRGRIGQAREEVRNGGSYDCSGYIRGPD